MTTKEFLNQVELNIKRQFYEERFFDIVEVIQVYYVKTIQNHKGIFIIKELDTGKILPDTGKILPYFIEATYNGDKSELYLDFYNKVDKTTYKIS